MRIVGEETQLSIDLLVACCETSDEIGDDRSGKRQTHGALCVTYALFMSYIHFKDIVRYCEYNRTLPVVCRVRSVRNASVLYHCS